MRGQRFQYSSFRPVFAIESIIAQVLLYADSFNYHIRSRLGRPAGANGAPRNLLVTVFGVMSLAIARLARG